jgi:hypothetical protein
VSIGGGAGISSFFSGSASAAAVSPPKLILSPANCPPDLTIFSFGFSSAAAVLSVDVESAAVAVESVDEVESSAVASVLSSVVAAAVASSVVAAAVASSVVASAVAAASSMVAAVPSALVAVALAAVELASLVSSTTGAGVM